MSYLNNDLYQYEFYGGNVTHPPVEPAGISTPSIRTIGEPLQPATVSANPPYGIQSTEIAPALGLTADEYFDGNETELQLQKAIASLPNKQRAVFHLKYYEEMKYEEMSSILNTSVGALKASYHHAVKKICDFFKSQD